MKARSEPDTAAVGSNSARMQEIRRFLLVIKSRRATRDDGQAETNAQTWMVLGAWLLVLGVLAVAIAYALRFARHA